MAAPGSAFCLESGRAWGTASLNLSFAVAWQPPAARRAPRTSPCAHRPSGEVCVIARDVRAWMAAAAQAVRTLPITRSVAVEAAALSAQPTFPRDPHDRMIYALARDQGAPLVTRDQRMRAFDAQTCMW